MWNPVEASSGTHTTGRSPGTTAPRRTTTRPASSLITSTATPPPTTTWLQNPRPAEMLAKPLHSASGRRQPRLLGVVPGVVVQPRRLGQPWNISTVPPGRSRPQEDPVRTPPCPVRATSRSQRRRRRAGAITHPTRRQWQPPDTTTWWTRTTTRTTPSPCLTSPQRMRTGGGWQQQLPWSRLNLASLMMVMASGTMPRSLYLPHLTHHQVSRDFPALGHSGHVVLVTTVLGNLLPTVPYVYCIIS